MRQPAGGSSYPPQAGADGRGRFLPRPVGTGPPAEEPDMSGENPDEGVYLVPGKLWLIVRKDRPDTGRGMLERVARLRSPVPGLGVTEVVPLYSDEDLGERAMVTFGVSPDEYELFAYPSNLELAEAILELAKLKDKYIALDLTEVNRGGRVYTLPDAMRAILTRRG